VISLLVLLLVLLVLLVLLEMLRMLLLRMDAITSKALDKLMRLRWGREMSGTICRLVRCMREGATRAAP